MYISEMERIRIYILEKQMVAKHLIALIGFKSIKTRGSSVFLTLALIAICWGSGLVPCQFI